jgi:anthranilate synthase/aminodeoxychorismate synthase-like glutamine amidotransferase
VILLLDNYDSFVGNLARYFEELGHETVIVRNDALSIGDVAAMQPRGIVISPGPCTPHEAGISIDLVRELSGAVPILGVCLGHQAIATAFGGNIVRAPEPVHGRTSLVHHQAAGLFAGLPSPFRATRYHSLIADEATLPAELTVTARTADGVIMGLAHQSRPCFGVQFHPESILTEHGHRLLANFLGLCGLPATTPTETDWRPLQPADRALPPLPHPVPWV